MKVKTLNLFVLFILFCQNIKAQSSYDPGYVLTIENDTINGYILNDIDSKLAYKISFKNELSDSTITQYTTKELLGFGFTSGRVFERMQIKNKNQASTDSSNVFAKKLIDGKIDLYIWRHKKINSNDYFITNNRSGREAQLTKPKNERKEIDGKIYSKTNYKYKNQIVYVENDGTLEAKRSKRLKFGEKAIGKEILSYNRNFQEEYPIKKYEEPYEFSYDILAGIPLTFNEENTAFMIGFFRNKTFVEKTNRISYLSGIIYRYWSSNDGNLDYQYESGTPNYRQQILNIIPVGVKFQGNSGRVIPYGYIGAGIAAMINTNHVIEDYENVGSQTTFGGIYPTVNAGVGAKIKVNSNYILTEIAPTRLAVYFNVGYSF